MSESEKTGPRPLFPPRPEDNPAPAPPPIPPVPPPPAAPMMRTEPITAIQIERIVMEAFARRLGQVAMPYGLGRLVAACEVELIGELVRQLKAPMP